MNFETGHIYHIYNQGNNKDVIFFNRENYLFFIKKIETHILPYADILAYCLMPNHFHLMVYVNEIAIKTKDTTHPMTQSHRMSMQMSMQTINQAIAVMLRSYTRAINIQENRSGSIFRPKTKAECLTIPIKEPPLWYRNNGEISFWRNISEKQYPQVCFNYIHNNPVKANLVKHPEEWEFSSYREYCGLRDLILINRNKAKEFGLI